MAKEDVLAFWEKVGEDEALSSKLETEVEPRSGWDAVVAFANSNGFAFTTDDYAEAVGSLPKDLSADGFKEWKDGGKSAELDDAALEEVAGGLSKIYTTLRQPTSPLRFGSPIRGILQPFGKILPGGGFGPVA